MQLDTGLQKSPTTLGRGDEAHVLAVGLVGGAQTEVCGHDPHPILGHVTHRQLGHGQGFGVEHVQHIRLVLGCVGAPGNAAHPVGVGDHPGVVASGNRVEPQGPGPVQQPVKLEVTVALDARIGGATGGVVGHVRTDHMGGELVGHVEHVVVDVELLGDASGVVNVGHRAAATVAVATPQPQGHPHHVVTSGHQQRRRHR